MTTESARPVVVVTGAAGGIGRVSVDRLIAEGMDVVATDLDVESVRSLSPHHFALDVTDPDDVQRVMEDILARLGRVDVLVNNAGITGSQAATTAGETPVSEFDHVMAVNVRGPFLCTRALLPSMIAAGSGQIITIASVAGLIAFPGRCAYTTSKGAAVMFARSLAIDYGPLGIRSNAICPGMVETPMTQWRLDQPDLRAKVEAMVPIGRVAQPEDIADAIALLASGRMAYANGSAIVIDGGWSSW
jgi:NAD(P)-dependent dehydrogenase (short-subunit alcohol dehydrogenase family)